jgi:hypothetical protein
VQSEKVKQYFVIVDKDDTVKRVCWAPLLWDIPNMGYRFTGFDGGIPKFLYDGPAMVSTGQQVTEWTAR